VRVALFAPLSLRRGRRGRHGTFSALVDRASLVGQFVLGLAAAELEEGKAASLPDEEKKSWHPHDYEIFSGQLMLPGVPEIAEKAALQKKMNSYGCLWVIHYLRGPTTTTAKRLQGSWSSATSA
jgi:hypothetical protein